MWEYEGPQIGEKPLIQSPRGSAPKLIHCLEVPLPGWATGKEEAITSSLLSSPDLQAFVHLAPHTWNPSLPLASPPRYSPTLRACPNQPCFLPPLLSLSFQQHSRLCDSISHSLINRITPSLSLLLYLLISLWSGQMCPQNIPLRAAGRLVQLLSK